MRIGRFLLVQVDLEEFVVIYAAEILVPSGIGYLTSRLIVGMPSSRVGFLEIGADESILVGFGKAGLVDDVPYRNKVSNRLLRPVTHSSQSWTAYGAVGTREGRLRGVGCSLAHCTNALNLSSWSRCCGR